MIFHDSFLTILDFIVSKCEQFAIFGLDLGFSAIYDLTCLVGMRILIDLFFESAEFFLEKGIFRFEKLLLKDGPRKMFL